MKGSYAPALPARPPLKQRTYRQYCTRWSVYQPRWWSHASHSLRVALDDREAQVIIA